MPDNDNKVTRRQFLNYTLMGVGGFMAAGMLTPMIRAAIDPVLKVKEDSGFIPVGDIKDLTNEPKRFDFKVTVQDAWHKSEETNTAWIYKDNDKIIAHSPQCKHLGCVVNWAGDPNKPNQYFCPCHNGYYEKDGTNVPNTPPIAPLDRFEVDVKDGTIYLGKIIPVA
ncbi:MAG: qcrA [Bacillales bacterium]|jgi:menaquinol-cytochrome c reductase iron-sulfur subunit|nr:qcrA [Bacillales bacterium]